MAVTFTVTITREESKPDKDDGIFCASSSDASGGKEIILGYGDTPYEALHDLIGEFEHHELYRED